MSRQMKINLNYQAKPRKKTSSLQAYPPFADDEDMNLSFSKSQNHSNQDLDDLGLALQESQNSHFCQKKHQFNFFGETSNPNEEPFRSSSEINHELIHPEQSEVAQPPEQLVTVLNLRTSSNDHHNQEAPEPEAPSQVFSAQSSSVRTKKIKKGDDRKNMFGHTLKAVIRAFISKNFEGTVHRILDRFGIEDASKVKDFIGQFRRASMVLKNVYGLLNFEAEADQQVRKYKQAFLVFYRWYMRNRMAVGVIREKSKVRYKSSYLRGKNFLAYLPALTANGIQKLKTPTKKNPRSLVVVNKDLSEFDLNI